MEECPVCRSRELTTLRADPQVTIVGCKACGATFISLLVPVILMLDKATRNWDNPAGVRPASMADVSKAADEAKKGLTILKGGLQ